MVLEIKLNGKKEKRLSKHLEEEHPSTKGRMKLRGESCVNKIIDNLPDFEKQAREFIKI